MSIRWSAHRNTRRNEPTFTVRILTPLGPREALEFHPRVRHLRTVSRLLLALAVLQVLDMASTLLLLSIGGQEANPVAAWFLGQGVGFFVALKTGLALALVAFVPLFERPKPPEGERTATWSCFGMDLVFAGVVVSNLAQFLLFS